MDQSAVGSGTSNATSLPHGLDAPLFKLAVRVVQYQDRIKLHLPTSCPLKSLLRTVTHILYLVRPLPCNTS